MSGGEIDNGEKLLITIIFVGTIVLFCILWTNRHISRMFLISKKGPHANVGNGATKDLKRKIDRYFGLINKLSIEPRLLSDQGCKDTVMSSFVERRDESTYLYRRKAFDLMSCLDDLLCRVDVCLARKPGQSVKEHMENLQKPPYAPFVDCKDLCLRVVTMYEHARYGVKPFEVSDFEKFSEEMNDLTKKVYNKLQVPGSLIVPLKRSLNEQSEASLLSGEKIHGIMEYEPAITSKVVYRRKDEVTDCGSKSDRKI